MAIDPLEIAAQRQAVAEYYLRAKIYRERAEMASTPRDQLRLTKLADMMEHKADRLSALIVNRIRMDALKAEYASQVERR